MPRRLPPLPADLQGRAFTVAEARRAAVRRRRLDGPDLLRPAWGLRCPSLPIDIDGHCRLMALVLPRPFAFSHLTAARLWRLPLPSVWQPHEPLHVTRDGTPVRRVGVVGHRGLSTRRHEDLRGLAVTSPVDTWADLAVLPGLGVDDLVVAGDAFATRDPGLLAAMVDASQRTGRRGTRLLRQAAPLLRVGSGSAMETRSRLAFRRGGLPEPELNAEVYAEDGHFIARVDFLWREARVIVEYEGDHHRTDRRQWQLDIQRVRLLESLGWRVLRITSRDLRRPGLTRLLSELTTLVA
jgi:hypothetical protein